MRSHLFLCYYLKVAKLTVKSPVELQHCRSCDADKPANTFTSRGWCKECSSNYDYKFRLKRVYGLTQEEYDFMLEKQEGRCAICRNKPGKRRLNVDHNHKTGQIRGLLCGRCNHKLLGSGNENSDILRRAADYLENNLGFPTYEWFIPGFGDD